MKRFPSNQKGKPHKIVPLRKRRVGSDLRNIKRSLASRQDLLCNPEQKGRFEMQDYGNKKFIFKFER